MQLNKELHKPINIRQLKAGYTGVALILLLPLLVLIILVLFIGMIINTRRQKAVAARSMEPVYIGNDIRTNRDGEEISSIQSFHKSIQTDEGFIVITDKVTGDHIHRLKCVWLKEEYFDKKVLQNRNEYGRYYWFENYTDATRRFPDAVPCGHCKPHV